MSEALTSSHEVGNCRELSRKQNEHQRSPVSSHRTRTLSFLQEIVNNLSDTVSLLTYAVVRVLRDHIYLLKPYGCMFVQVDVLLFYLSALCKVTLFLLKEIVVSQTSSFSFF